MKMRDHENICQFELFAFFLLGFTSCLCIFMCGQDNICLRFSRCEKCMGISPFFFNKLDTKSCIDYTNNYKNNVLVDFVFLII